MSMISAQDLLYADSTKPLSFEVMPHTCMTICSRHDDITTGILRKCAGFDLLQNSEKVGYQSGINADDLAEVCYFFKTGIMLSNLTLRENLSLPYRYHYPRNKWQEYDERVQKWVKFFHLDVDLSERPALINLSELKIIAYIRSLVLQPLLYICDAPFFQLSYPFQKKIIDCFALLKEFNNTLLIGTSDFELIEKISDQVILVDKDNYQKHYDLNTTDRIANLQAIATYLNE